MKKKILVLAALAAVSGAFVATAAMAQPSGDNTRPGWGFGDKSHVHTGPPGQSVRPH